MNVTGGITPQLLNVSDCTRGQMEQVLRLTGLAAGGIRTGAVSLKPGAPFRDTRVESPTALWVLQGAGTCELRDSSGNRAVIRLRRGAHFTVEAGTWLGFENTGRSLLIVLTATA